MFSLSDGENSFCLFKRDNLTTWTTRLVQWLSGSGRGFHPRTEQLFVWPTDSMFVNAALFLEEKKKGNKISGTALFLFIKAIH